MSSGRGPGNRDASGTSILCLYFVPSNSSLKVSDEPGDSHESHPADSSKARPRATSARRAHIISSSQVIRADSSLGQWQ